MVNVSIRICFALLGDASKSFDDDPPKHRRYLISPAFFALDRGTLGISVLCGPSKAITSALVSLQTIGSVSKYKKILAVHSEGDPHNFSGLLNML